MPGTENPAGASSRAISGLEFLIGVALVIGHNVYRVVPNEVPILFLIAFISSRLRNGNWTVFGLVRPLSWKRVLAVAFAAAVVRIVAGELLIDPLTRHFWPPIIAPAGTSEITGNLRNAGIALLIIWTFAAFGEEISYRGYLTTRLAEFSGGKRWAWWLAVLLVSILFGYGHFYKGPAGIVDSAFAGLVLGVAYLVTGRNLWAPILAHGFIDTFAVILVYLGLAN